MGTGPLIVTLLMALQVQVLHNERVVPQPMCGGATVCGWDMFKAAQAKHLQMDYHSVCTPAGAAASAGDASAGDASAGDASAGDASDDDTSDEL